MLLDGSIIVSVILRKLFLEGSGRWSFSSLQLSNHRGERMIETRSIMWCIQDSISLTVIGQVTYDTVSPFKIRSFTWSSSPLKLLWLPLIVDQFHIYLYQCSPYSSKRCLANPTFELKDFVYPSVEVATHKCQQLRADLVYILLRMSLIASPHIFILYL